MIKNKNIEQMSRLFPKVAQASSLFSVSASVRSCLSVFLMFAIFVICEVRSFAESADEILKEIGIAGGLIVHLGCGDGKLTLKLYVNNHCVVHGLDANSANITEARKYIEKKGLYGKISVEHWDKSYLPYVDNLVNLIISDNLEKISNDEIIRVLAPLGVAYVKTDNKWTKIVKPYPKEMDEWTHYLHEADNNPVAKDKLIAPPKSLQWIAYPKWSRQHEHMSSLNALVSSKGRIFYIFDEGPTESIIMPSKWSLVAKDAFNGIQLWKRPIKEWFNRFYKLKSGPASLPRRLVAVNDRVYVTLGIDAPVSALNAKTGETIITYSETEKTREIIYMSGRLFVVTGNEKDGQVIAIEAKSGEILWKKQEIASTLTLAANAQHVVFSNGKEVICLEQNTGNELWRSNVNASKAKWTSKSTPRLLLSEKVVIIKSGKMTALSIKDGKTLWSATDAKSGYASPQDLMLIKGNIWTGAIAGNFLSGEFTGINSLTGSVEDKFSPDINEVWLSHHRCHFAKATENYILTSRMGVEFIDLKAKKWNPHHWIRGACLYGIMPANGLIYTPPHPCACYIEVNLHGLSALAPERKSDFTNNNNIRLEKGSAYNQLVPFSANVNDWTTYRHDNARSGSSKSCIPSLLHQSWISQIGGRLSPPVMANGQIIFSSIDSHTIHALSAETGEKHWSYVAGGRVDSPPTLYKGCVLFGSRDGWIYCLRTTDGFLMWRFKAVPMEQKMMAYEQLESAWPVSGSVLIKNDILYCIVGRSMFLNGGLRLLQLEPLTGKLISENIMDENDPANKADLMKYDTYLDMSVALPDILSADKDNLYMRSMPFDLKGKRRRISHIPTPEENNHLFSPTGFLDDTWFHRTFWVYARAFPGGWNGQFSSSKPSPAGRLLVFDDVNIYGYVRDVYGWKTTLKYHLFAMEKNIQPYENYPKSKEKNIKKSHINFARISIMRKNEGKNKQKKKWNVQIPILVKAMTSAFIDENNPSKCILVAGPPDFFSDSDINDSSFKGVNDIKKLEKFNKRSELLDQTASLKGKKGALLCIISSEDGSTIAEYKLKSLPVFDGMIVAGNKVFIATVDGKIVCYK